MTTGRKALSIEDIGKILLTVRSQAEASQIPLSEIAKALYRIGRGPGGRPRPKAEAITSQLRKELIDFLRWWYGTEPIGVWEEEEVDRYLQARGVDG